MPETLTASPFADVANSHLEDAVSQASESMTALERRAANGALLARLAEAKAAYAGPQEQHKQMLKDPEISALVNALVVLNEPWIKRVITSEKRDHRLADDVEELTSIAVAGRTSLESDVGGAMGAILHYDYGRFGDQSFTPYLGLAVRNALTPSITERRAESFRHSCAHPDDTPESVRWVDRCGSNPEAPVIEADLLSAIHQTVDAMPAHRRDIARFMIDSVLETGELPTFKEIGLARNPPVSKQRGQQLAEDAITCLVTCLEERYPQLAEDGLSGWEAFRDTLKGKRQTALRA